MLDGIPENITEEKDIKTNKLLKKNPISKKRLIDKKIRINPLIDGFTLCTAEPYAHR